MQDFSFADAVRLVMRTWPFVVARFAAVCLLMATFLGMIAAGGVLGYAGGQSFAPGLEPAGATLGGMAGIWLGGQLAGMVHEYVIYLVKAGHIAVMVEMLDGKAIAPAGQIAHGRAVVKDRFVEASVLFALDQLIKTVLSAMNKMAERLARATLIPGATLFTSLIDEVAKVSIGLLDEVILAHNIRAREENPWQGGVNALILYFQNTRVMLRNAGWLTLYMFLSTGVIILAVIAPFKLGLVPLHETAIPYAPIGGILLVLILMVTFLEPLAIAALLQIYFKVTDGQVPNRKWEAEIIKHAPAFMDLKERAADWEKGHGAPFPGGRTA
ncbi:MAG: hypothetical protein KDJ74_02330 [Notoacmeibacter sp.]|nr:hypothetical protein [Notoacmeibacter sp.]